MILLKKFKVLDPSKSYVLMDFDRTITAQDSETTWGLLEHSQFVDPNYSKASLEIYEHYRPIELDHTMSFEEKERHMEEWFTRVAGLWNKYHIFKSTVTKILSNPHGMRLRKGAKNFLEQMHMLDVPVIIVSAGLGDFIDGYMKQEHIMFDNITIYSNFLIFDENGKVTGIKQPILHSLNKYQIDYSDVIGSRETGLLFGDQIEDREMGRGLDTLDIGFCNPEIHNIDSYRSNFDIVLTGGSSYNEIGSIMIKNYKI